MNKFSLTFFNRLYTSYRNTVSIKENFFLKKKLDFEKSYGKKKIISKQSKGVERLTNFKKSS